MNKFIHIDMDCFFAAIEMRDDPCLRDLPIAVGGGADTRGVICTANYYARQFGVHSAMSTFKALNLCPNLRVIPVRMDSYEAESGRIIEIFSRYTELVEPLALDEAYLDVTNCRHCHGSATLVAEEIRKTIFNELQLTASAGIAPVKFIAKIASSLNKPNGQFVIPPKNINTFIQALPLKKIPGIGPKTDKRLFEMGLKTCKDVQNHNLSDMLRKFGKVGYMIWRRCHGIDENSLCIDPARKSVGVEVTLAKDIHQWSECAEIIEQLFPKLIKRVERHKSSLRISRQGLKFKFDDFRLTTHEHNYPILDLDYMLSMARNAWNTRLKGRGVRLVGLHVGLKYPPLDCQLSLNL